MTCRTHVSGRPIGRAAAVAGLAAGAPLGEQTAGGDGVSLVNNIYNPTRETSTDSVNRELRRFAALGGFRR